MYCKPGLIAFALCFLLAWAAPTPARALDIIRDEEIEETLKIIAKPILEEAGIAPDDVTFLIIKDPAVNAFVAGGMNMFFYTGLLLETQNAEELAGVIAHEASHIAFGHLTRTKAELQHASAQTILASILGIAAAVATGNSQAGVAVATGGGHLAASQFLKFSREQESAADQGAINYLKASRVSIKGMLEFLDRLAGQELLPEGRKSEYVRTHPLAMDRVAFLRYTIQQNPYSPTLPETWNSGHARMHAKLIAYLDPDRALQKYAVTGKEDEIPNYAQAIAFYRKNAFDRALGIINTLVGKHPQNAYYHELKGQILFDHRKATEAAESYKKAVELMPDAALLRIALAQALLDSKPQSPELAKEAISTLGRALQIEAKSPRSHRLMATAYGRLKNEPMAQLHLAEEALLRNDLDNAEKLAKLAQQGLPKESKTSLLRTRDLLDYVHALKKKKKD